MQGGGGSPGADGGWGKWGGGNSGAEATVRGGQPLRTTIHTISLQNRFYESHTRRLESCKALRELKAHWAIPAHPVFEDENSNASDEKLAKQKIA